MRTRIRENPNASVAVGSGGTATLLVGTLSWAGVDIDPVFAAALAGALTTAVLLVGRKGVRGLLGQFWRGSETSE